LQDPYIIHYKYFKANTLQGFFKYGSKLTKQVIKRKAEVNGSLPEQRKLLNAREKKMLWPKFYAETKLKINLQGICSYISATVQIHRRTISDNTDK